jgi:hypothetical protein
METLTLHRHDILAKQLQKVQKNKSPKTDRKKRKI